MIWIIDVSMRGCFIRISHFLSFFPDLHDEDGKEARRWEGDRVGHVLTAGVDA